MKQQRLITRLTGRGDELDAPLREGGRRGRVSGTTSLTSIQTSVCVCECLNIRLFCWQGGFIVPSFSTRLPWEGGGVCE